MSQQEIADLHAELNILKNDLKWIKWSVGLVYPILLGILLEGVR
jgi:hypothetical protein